MSEWQNRPVLDKVNLDDGTTFWVLEVHGAPDIRFDLADKVAANAAWTSATWGYHNGRRDVQAEIKQALGITADGGGEHG